MPRQQQSQPQMAQGQPQSLIAQADMAMDIGFGVSCICGNLVEQALRSRQGTRYNHPVMLGMSMAFLWACTAVSMMAGRFNDDGLIGMGSLALAFTALQWVNLYGTLRRMIRPHEERYSKEDGVPLPLMKKLPHGEDWSWVRFVWEPSLIIAVALVLRMMHVLTSAAALYLAVAAIALFCKVGFLWFSSWVWLREILDQLGLSERLSGNRSQGGIEHAKQAVLNAVRNIPASLPLEAIASVKRLAAQTLPRELSELITQPEDKLEQGGKSLEQGIADLLSPPEAV